MLTTLFSRGDDMAEYEPIPKPNQDLGDSAIVRRRPLDTAASEIDLFEQARKIYSRGRRRFSRRASRIV